MNFDFSIPAGMSQLKINGRYNVQKKLSSKAAVGCSVYIAEDTHRFNELCTLQECPAQEKALQEAAKILYQLEHPQIVRFRGIFNAFREAREYSYLVEDYIDGLNYAELSQLYYSHESQLSEKEVLEKIKDILLVLDFLHQKSIAHGDLTLFNLIEDNETHKPILINFANARQDSAGCSKDIADLAEVANSFLHDEPSPQMSNLLEGMRKREFPCAISLLKEIDSLALNPVESDTTVVTPVKKNKKTSSINPLLGCLGKIALVLGLSLGAGRIGWMAGKFWLSNKIESPKTNEVTQSPSPTVTLTPASINTNSDVHQRLLDLKISDEKYFNSLVDQVFYGRFPELRNKTNNDIIQKKWDQVADEILDHLNTIKPQALDNLGKYTPEDISRWSLAANKLHLSSRSLFALADGQYRNWFGGLDFQGQPSDQIRDALIYSQLLSLKAGENYQKLNSLPPLLQGTLQSGQGQAYSVRLIQGKQVAFNLEPTDNLQLSIYSPTGKNNLLEESSKGQWSGTLPETGYYEIIISSQSKEPINYQLKSN